MPRRKGNRRPKAGGTETYARVNGKQVTKWWPAGTSDEQMDRWVRSQKALRLSRRERNIRVGRTLASLVEDYLGTLGPVPQRREAKWGVHPKLVGTMISGSTTRRRIDAETHLRPWVDAYGPRHLETLSYEDCRDHLARRVAARYSASSVNKARTYFMSLWRWAFGSLDDCPMKKAPKMKEPKALPRAQDPALLWLAINGMEACETRARLKMALATGMRPIEVMTLQPEDLHHQEVQPYLFARTAKGGIPRVVPLNANGVFACEEFIATKAWGTYSQSSARTRLLAALERVGLTEEQMLEVKAGEGRLRNRWKFQPYVLRHTFASSVRQKGADLADVQEILGHQHADTTKRYAPVVSEKLYDAIQRVEHTPPPLPE